MVRRRRGLALRRGRARRGVAVRARPRPRVRPGRRTRRPQGPGRVGPRQDDPPRGIGLRPQYPGPGHGGLADHAPGGRGTAAEPRMSTPGGSGRAAAPSRPRVVIVDDHGLFRSGVRSELGDQVEVVGEADDVQPAISVITQCLPDVVLLDVPLPGGGGQLVLSSLRAALPEVRFLALSASDAPEDVIAVIRAGARGYVTKTISIRTVETHVSSVLRKLQLSTRHQLTRWAAERKLT